MKTLKALKDIDLLVGIQIFNWSLLCILVLSRPINTTDLVLFVSVSIIMLGFLYLREALRTILEELRKK